MAGSNDNLKTGEQIQTQTVEVPKSSKEVPANAEGNTSEDSGPTLDYAGSAEKTDPEEIRLVRKLDRWILVSLSALTSTNRLWCWARLPELARMLTCDSRCYGCSTSST